MRLVILSRASRSLICGHRHKPAESLRPATPQFYWASLVFVFILPSGRSPCCESQREDGKEKYERKLTLDSVGIFIRFVQTTVDARIVLRSVWANVRVSGFVMLDLDSIYIARLHGEFLINFVEKTICGRTYVETCLWRNAINKLPMLTQFRIFTNVTKEMKFN